MSLLRLIDANANRAREAMRVMEDAARFLLDDAELAGSLKRLRHDLADALAAFPNAALHRDTPGDVGTRIATDAENRRDSTHGVVTAAGKRLSEALRALEEFAKLPAESPPGAPQPHPARTQAAPAFESLRYRGYDLEQRLARQLAGGRARQWRLCVLISEHLCHHHGWLDVVRACVDAGVDCLQLREKQLPGGELVRRARDLLELARPRGVSVVLNDRPDAALVAGVDGVHLGQHDLPCRDVRRWVGSALIVGVSTSKIDQARAALRDGADYCGLGPMFPSTTAPDKDRLAGPAYLRAYLDAVPLPHLAIGGVTPDNLDQLVEAGARGVAVSAAVCGAKDPGRAAAALLAALPDSPAEPTEGSPPPAEPPHAP